MLVHGVGQFLYFNGSILENHDTRDEVEQEEQEDQREQNEQDEQEDQCDQDEQGDHDEETDQEQLNKFELEELRANLAEVTHNECDWEVQEKCVVCLFKIYQGDCIDALESGELRKMEIADAMALIGVFAPHIPAPRMLRVFGSALDDVVAPVRLPMPDINDSAIMAAVRHCINGDPDDASEALRPLDRKLRIMIESL
ncbi:hypothetical protein EDD21DRAFT_4623 [Dissophora ornata]|nr:hypothetical protein EDD21DRAFT_4623 [Dissophora ornata]